jgi:hypothetical protein
MKEERKESEKALLLPFGLRLPVVALPQLCPNIMSLQGRMKERGREGEREKGPELLLI